jgi:AbiV family abortive infection protein
MSAIATKRIAERYVGPLKEPETAQAIGAVRANVSELVSAADALAAAGIYSKSCALSILAVEESQKISMLLNLLYADTPDEQREIWKEFRNHRKKHINLGLDIASSAVIEGTIAPEAAAVALKAKEAPDPDNLEELKQALIYSDCITDAQGLPQWSWPAGISAEADAKRLLESAREAEAHLYPFSEAELRVWKRHMAPVRSSTLKEQLEHMRKCEAELKRLGLPVPTRLQKV